MNIAATLKRSLSILPIGRCPLCTLPASSGRFCHGCSQDIAQSRAAGGPRCPKCHLFLGSDGYCPECPDLAMQIRRLEFAFDYVPPLEQLILQFKEGKRYQMASALAGLIANSDSQILVNAGSDSVLVAVPSDLKALRRRGYNPAWQFARQLSKQTSLPLLNEVLLKRSTRQQQKGLSAQARRLHMIDRFYCRYPLARQHVILVDDVLTTGATLQACAQALRAASVRHVDAIVIARAIPKQQ